MAWCRPARRSPRNSASPSRTQGERGLRGRGAAGRRGRRGGHQGNARHLDPLRADRRSRRSWSRRRSGTKWRMPNSSAIPSRASPTCGRTRSPPKGGQVPDEDIEAIQRVTAADVNRVAKRYLADQNSITAVLKPVPTGQPVATKGFGGRGTGDLRSHQAGAITCLGGGGAGPAQDSGRLHQGLRHDAGERHSPHREDRSDHPDRRRCWAP